MLTIAALLITLGTAYTTYQVTISDHDSRLRSLEKQTLNLDSRTSAIYDLISNMRSDVAIIKYRIENDQKKSLK